MPENGMTIHHKGNDYFLDLSEDQADKLSNFVNIVNGIPRAPEEPLPEWRVQERKQSRENYEKSANLNNIVPNIVELSDDDLILLKAFLDVIEAAKSACDGRNWIFETIDSLLLQVTMEGPFAANEMDPRLALVGMADDIEVFWFWINDAKGMLENHRRLCPAPPSAESEAVTEPTAASSPAKPRRARHKARRKAA
jgi:hypothetical protein